MAIYEAGKYNVYYETTQNSDTHHTVVDLPKCENDEEVHAVLKTLISGFDFVKKREKAITLISLLDFTKKVIICDYDNEAMINDCLDRGYRIREFVKDKCILERRTL